MSLSAYPSHQRGKGPPSQAQIQKLLDENNQLIQTMIDFQNKGSTQEIMQYQQMLHKNLIYLATVADHNQTMQGGLMSGLYLAHGTMAIAIGALVTCRDGPIRGWVSSGRNLDFFRDGTFFMSE